jgi:glycosyltransferase involved in cell wall biosynthesis
VSSSQVSVLCTHATSFEGGVLRVLRDGLPHLAKRVKVTLADLYARHHLFSDLHSAEITINTDIGVATRPYISASKGFSYLSGALRHVPGHLSILNNLRSAGRKFQVVYVHNYKDLALVTIASELAGSSFPIVWHCHGLDDELPPLGLRWMANRCNRILAISNSVRDRLIEIGIDRNKLRVVYNAVSPATIQRLARADSPGEASQGRFTILVPTASLRQTKGIHLAITALSQIPKHSTLWITGNTDDDVDQNYISHLKALVEGYGLHERVQFLGLRRDIYQLMRKADLICLPSLNREGFGLVVAEAMCLQKPVVVSNRGGLPEVVGHGSAGVVFNPQEEIDLPLKLTELIGNPERRRALATSGYDFVKRNFTHERWSDAVAEELCTATH